MLFKFLRAMILSGFIFAAGFIAPDTHAARRIDCSKNLLEIASAGFNPMEVTPLGAIEKEISQIEIRVDEMSRSGKMETQVIDEVLKSIETWSADLNLNALQYLSDVDPFAEVDPLDTLEKRLDVLFVRLLESLLKAQDIAFEVIINPATNRHRIQISATKGNSRLNKIARRVFETLNSNIYLTLFDLVGGGLGAYSSEENAIFISSGLLTRSHQIFKSLLHEIRHAHYEKLRKVSKDSVFHGLIQSTDSAAFTDPSRGYKKYLSLEELSTFGLNLNLIASQLRKLMQENAQKKVLDLWNDLSQNLQTFEELNLTVQEIMGPALKKLNHGKLPVDSELQSLVTSQGPISYLSLQFRHKNARVTIPVVDATWSKKFNEQMAGANQVIETLMKQETEEDLSQLVVRVRKLAAGPRELIMQTLTKRLNLLMELTGRQLAMTRSLRERLQRWPMGQLPPVAELESFLLDLRQVTMTNQEFERRLGSEGVR